MPSVCVDGLVLPLTELPALPPAGSAVYNATIPALSRTSSASKTLSATRGSPTKGHTTTRSRIAQGAVSQTASSRKATATGTLTNTLAVVRQSIAHWRDTYPGCPTGAAELFYTVTPSAELFLTAEALRARGVVLEVKVQSCHWLKSAMAVLPVEEAATARLPLEVQKTIALGTGTTLTELLAARPQLLRQELLGGGRALRVSLGPLHDYFPVGPDGIVLSSAAIEDLVHPAPLLRSNGTGTAVIPRLVLRVAAEQRPVSSPTTTAVVSGGTLGIGVVGAAFGSGAMAAAAQRQALLANVAHCPRSLETGALPPEVHPLRFSLGDDFGAFKYHLSAVAGNLAIIAAIFLLHFLVACVVALSQRVPMGVGLEWARFPGKSFPLTALFMQGALSSALTVVFFSTSPTRVAIGGMAAFFVVMLSVIASLVLVRGQSTFDARFSEKARAGRSCAARLTMNVGRWVPRRPTRERFLRMYGPLFEDLRPASAHFFLIDVVVLLASSYMMALVPDSEAKCDFLFGCVVALFILYAVIVVATRPFLSVIGNVSFAATAVAQAGSAASLLLAYQLNSQRFMDVSEMLNMAVVGIQVLQTVASIVKAADDWRTDSLQPDKAIRQERELAEQVHQRTALELAFAFSSVAPR